MRGGFLRDESADAARKRIAERQVQMRQLVVGEGTMTVDGAEAGWAVVEDPPEIAKGNPAGPRRYFVVNVVLADRWYAFTGWARPDTMAENEPLFRRMAASLRFQ